MVRSYTSILFLTFAATSFSAYCFEVVLVVMMNIVCRNHYICIRMLLFI
uniref:Uncharacterized protein n=1 Tax=Arundo donax TaxID=35708 RepID=A0A0A8ZGP0_ARUDO